MKRYKPFVCVLVFGILLSAGFAETATETVLDLDTAVALALEQNLSLGRSKRELEQKKLSSVRSWNSLIPSIGASASVSRATDITGNIIPSQDEWKPALSLSASFTLPTSIFADIESARLEYEAGQISYDTAARTLELQVRKAFYQLLVLNENIALTQQSIETAQGRYDEAAAKRRVGQASNLEELSAKVDLENLKPTLRSAQGAYDTTLDSFRQILGISLDEDVRISGNLASAVGIVESENMESLTERSLGEASAVLSARKDLEIAESRLKGAKSSLVIPSLSVSWNTSPLYANSAWSDTGGFTAKLSFSLDKLLPWSSAQTQIESLSLSLASSQSALLEKQITSELNIRQYQRTIEESLESIDALRLNAELAEQNYGMYEQSYRQGTADYQSLRTAGDSLQTARNKVLQEFYTLLTTVLDLEAELNIPFGTLMDI
ncbi:MAG: TolC family protein [Spirochaetaceae bacterium]|nr:TolC family protein [Spirochaetaceae bacterium]